MQHFDGDLRNGLVITLIDAWVLDPEQLSRTNVACWTPVDHDPVPPQVARVLDASQAFPVAMSRFGERALTAAGLTPLYAPHAIDTTIFAPPVDKQQLQNDLGIPADSFVIGMVAANKGFPPRKGFPEAVAAFARFHADHPDAFLVLHTEPHGVFDGVPIPAILQHYGVPPDRMTFSLTEATMGPPDDFMARLFGSFDVLLNPAYGEGFGIPVLEAQACGVPVIVTDWTAMPEVGEVGWKVGGQQVWTQQRSFQKVPDVEQLVWALGDAHRRAGRMSDAAREHALAYDVDTVYAEHWEPLLETVAERCGLDVAQAVAA